VIVKHLSRKSNSAQLIRYVLRYVLREEKTQTDSHLILKHNVTGTDINNYITQFKQNEQRRIKSRKNHVLLHHVILSWSTKDATHVTDHALQAMAKQYITLRGKNNLYLGAKHTDKDHIHLHLITSGCQINGRSNRISKKAFAQLKLDLDAFQLYHFPELSHSLPMHGQKQHNRTLKTNTQPNRFSQKEQLIQQIHPLYATATSPSAFESELQAHGYTPYSRTNTLTGIILESGRKYRFKTLGIDLQTMNAHQKALSDLQAIRSPTHERSKEVMVTKTMKQEATEPDLQDIATIRSAARGARGNILER
jgi:hypothetical protein